MIIPPFDARAIASSHSALTGLMAGFAFAALFLLIERVGFKSTTQKDLSRAMLLLFIASLVGTLAAFLYSSIVGISKVRAYFDFVITAPVFAITTFILLAGVNEVLSVFGIIDIIDLARRISYFVIFFSILRVWQDLSPAASIFGTGNQVQIVLVIAFVGPLLIAAAVLVSKYNPLIQWFNHKSFSAFCYASVLISFGIAFLIAVHNAFPELQLRLSEIEVFLLMVCLSSLGAWTILLLPQESKAIREK
jgi:hypothetical protein